MKDCLIMVIFLIILQLHSCLIMLNVSPGLTIIVSAISSFFAGWCYVIAATVYPSKIFKTSFIFSFILFLSALNLVYAVFISLWLWVLSISFIFFILGYLLKSKIFLSTQDKVVLPNVIPDNIKFKGHTAVIYFTHGEPETYDPIGWLNQFREFDEQKVKFIPFIARVFFINSLRKKYMQAGKSNHRAEHFRMMKQTEELVKVRGNYNTHFYMAFLDDKPGIKRAVTNAINEGAGRIVISNVFLTVSSHTACGFNMIKCLDCEKKYGIKVGFTEPLWESEYLKRAFVEKVNISREETNKEKIAIVLVGYGQPAEWDKTFPSQTKQEIIFRENIIEMFVEDGYNRENLGMAWMEFKKPNINDLLLSLNFNNIQKVYYFAAAISADALISQVLIPEKFERFPFPKHVQLINMGAWDAHPLVIRAIAENIKKVLDESKIFEKKQVPDNVVS